MRHIIFILALFACNICIACSCIGTGSISEAFKKSDVVVCGTIISRELIEIVDSTLPSELKLKRVKFTMVNVKLFKGSEAKDTLTIITGVGKGDCGFQFKLNTSYIVYCVHRNRYFAYGNIIDSFLYTDVCSRTMQFSKREIRQIRKKLKTI